MEFPNLICTNCNSPLEETGKVIRRLDPGPLILCTSCRTYYQMFGQNETVYIVPVYQEFKPAENVEVTIDLETSLKEKIAKATTVTEFLKSIK